MWHVRHVRPNESELPMRTLRAPLRPLLLLASLVLTAAGCAQSVKTDAHFDPSYDFDRVATFAFAPMRQKVARSEGGKILQATLRDLLVERGYVEAERATADVLIHYDLGLYARADVSGGLYRKTEGGLTVEVMDRESGRTVWYGWSELVLRPGDEDRDAVIRKAATALFERHVAPKR